MATQSRHIEILRFNTCGSVDDGKSTLIGRLLYDSKSLMEDQVEALERSADITRGGQINLANLTDGLRAECEQGITIGVAYRYFATPRRKFIVADTPGHIQYTRNMVTGASTANLTVGERSHCERLGLASFRFPVQWINRPKSLADKSRQDSFGLSGQVASGIVHQARQVVLLPHGI
jgi:sulfate adenylyltransferase subunit 1 (EFTu-like GTPase family)